VWDPSRPTHLLPFAKRDRLSGDGREAFAIETDDDGVALARVLVDGRMFREAKLCDEEVLFAYDDPPDHTHDSLAWERIPSEAWERPDVDGHLEASEA
jgi:hypothetical protein